MSDPAPFDPADAAAMNAGTAPLPLAPWAIVQIGRDGRISGWSPAAAELFGLPAADAVGRHYLELADPAFRDRVGAAFDTVLAGRPAGPDVVAVPRGEGRSVLTVWTAVPLRDAAGAVSGLLATGIRLSAVAAGEPRRTAERFWRGLFDANPLALVVLDADDHVLGVNPRFSELFGYAEIEVLGRPVHEVLGGDRHRPGEGAPGAEDASRLLAVGERLTFRAERRTKGGDRVPVHVEAAVFETDDGRRGLIVAYRRLEDQQQFEAQLLRAQRMEGVALLASGVLHDINNLLMVVLGQAEAVAALPADAPLGPERREDVLLLLDAARRAATLARMVGSFAGRRGAGRDSEREPVDVAHLLGTLRPVLERLVGRLVAVRLDPGPPAEPVLAVPQELEQVFVNLAANAHDAMPNGGELRVRVRAARVGADEAVRRGLDPGPHVAVEVRDTGAGMTPEVRRRAFEPFFTTKGATHGTGLGLATVQRIVERLGGAVWVESREGEGATFHLLLPVRAADDAGGVPSC